MRVASYNVRNLIPITGAAPTSSGTSEARACTADPASVDGDCVADSSPVAGKSTQELRALSGTIAAVGADVLLLQEVGSSDLLAELNDSLVSPYPYFEVLPGNSNRGIHLGIMSREAFQLTSHRDRQLSDEAGRPLSEYHTEADARAGSPQPLLIQRDLMLAEVLLDGLGTLALFNVHLKSKTNRDWRLLGADVIRSAECRQIADLIGAYRTAHPDRPTLLGGDFNDTRASATLRPLFGIPLNDPLGEQLQKTGRNPSTYWPKRRMRLDFLLTDRAAHRLLIPGSAQIHANQRAKRASDHYPVSLDLDEGRWPAGSRPRPATLR